MKKGLIFFIYFGFYFSMVYAQAFNIGINRDLARQIGENYKKRIKSELAIKKSIKQQQGDYRRIFLKSAMVNKMKEDMYNAVYKVNNEIKNGKQLKYLKKLLSYEIPKNYEETWDLAYENPKYYEEVIEMCLYMADIREKMYIDAHTIFTPTKGVHIDNYDRLELITKITQRAKKLNEEILLIKFFLKTSKMIDDTKNAIPLKNYINRDKKIMESVMEEYKDKF